MPESMSARTTSCEPLAKSSLATSTASLRRPRSWARNPLASSARRKPTSASGRFVAVGGARSAAEGQRSRRFQRRPRA